MRLAFNAMCCALPRTLKHSSGMNNLPGLPHLSVSHCFPFAQSLLHLHAAFFTSFLLFCPSLQITLQWEDLEIVFTSTC